MKHAVSFLLLLFVFGAWPESFPVTSRYDRTSDTTVTQIELLHDDGAPAALTLQAHTAFRGKEPNASGHFWFTLTITQGHMARKAAPLLAPQEALHLALDGTPLEVPLSDYHREYYELVQRVSESAHAAISRNDLLRLLATKELSGYNGKFHFKLPTAALTALNQFITHHVLAE